MCQYSYDKEQERVQQPKVQIAKKTLKEDNTIPGSRTIKIVLIDKFVMICFFRDPLFRNSESLYLRYYMFQIFQIYQITNFMKMLSKTHNTKEIKSHLCTKIFSTHYTKFLLW